VEKIVGYVLLAVGLVFVFLPMLLALSMFLGGTRAPQLITSAGASDPFAAFSNTLLTFFILIIITWAGSITSSRGVTLIKEIKFKVVRESLGEEVKVVKKENA